MFQYENFGAERVKCWDKSYSHPQIALKWPYISLHLYEKCKLSIEPFFAVAPGCTFYGSYPDRSCTCSTSSAHRGAERVLGYHLQRRKLYVCQSYWHPSLSQKHEDITDEVSDQAPDQRFRRQHLPIRFLYPLRSEFLISCSSLMDLHCTFIRKYSSLKTGVETFCLWCITKLFFFLQDQELMV